MDAKNESNDEIIFLKTGFEKSDYNISHNNFMASTLHCLININFLTNFITNFDTNSIKNDFFEKYKELLNDLISLNNKNDNDNDNKKISLKTFEQFLFSKEEYKNENNHNPKFLINNMINEFNLYIFSEFKNSKIADNFYITLQKVRKCSICNNYSEDTKIEEKFLIFDFCKLYNDKKGDKKLDIYDCLKSYTNEDYEDVKLQCDFCKKETEHKIRIIFKSLPNILIFFVDYGNNNNLEFKGDFTFNDTITFDEKLLPTIKNVEINYKNKEYYLSSLICVREIMSKKEHYHTFCRENEHENYYCYNGDMIHEVKNINNKIGKDIIQLNNKKERLPYALIYISNNKN